MTEQSPPPIASSSPDMAEGGQDAQGQQSASDGNGYSFLNMGMMCCGTRTDQRGHVKEPKAAQPPRQAEELKAEVAKTEAQRKNSLTEVAKNLEGVEENLRNAEVKLAPWSEVKEAKEKLEDMQRAVGEEINDAEQKLAEGEGSREEGGILENFTEVPALRKELSEKQLKR